MRATASVFHMCFRTELRSSGLQGKPFYVPSHLPNPSSFLEKPSLRLLISICLSGTLELLPPLRFSCTAQGELSVLHARRSHPPPPLHSNHAHTVQGADARLFMESRCRVPANTNSAQHSPNYRQHARARSFCESLEMHGWPHRISLDEFCNFPIFGYHGVFSEVEHDNRAGGCHISWRISRSKLKGSSPLHAEGRNIDRDRVRGLESRPGSLLPLSSIFRSGACGRCWNACFCSPSLWQIAAFKGGPRPAQWL